jgi:hypothetical protein
MLTECNTDLFEFAPVERRGVVAAFDGGAMSSDVERCFWAPRIVRLD